MNLAEPILKLFRKKTVPAIETGDIIRVHQKIKEGAKERIQVFEGIVIAKHNKKDLDATFTVRKIASGIGVEKTFLLHSPNITKIEFKKSSRVRRSKLYFLRDLTGKALKLKEKKGNLKDSWEFVAADEKAQTEASEEDIAEAVAADEAKKEEEEAKATVETQGSPSAGLGMQAKGDTVEKGGDTEDKSLEEVKDEVKPSGGTDAETKPAESGDGKPDQESGE